MIAKGWIQTRELKEGGKEPQWLLSSFSLPNGSPMIVCFKT